MVHALGKNLPRLLMEIKAALVPNTKKAVPGVAAEKKKPGL